MAQSWRDSRGLANADGWGIGFYADGRPEIERCDSAAYRDIRFVETAERINSPTVLAHVRQATVGGTDAANSHPFSNGVWSLAHNGTLTGFDRLAPALEAELDSDLLEARRGTTDSELIFLWLLNRARAVGLGIDSPCGDLGALVEVFVGSIRELAARSSAATTHETAKLNLVLTDGASLVASRWGNTLHFLRRDGVHDCDICGTAHVQAPRAEGFTAALVASEPITPERWEAVPDRSVVTIDESVTLQTLSI